MGQIKIVQDRERLLDELPKDSICAEIGVLTGSFSTTILHRCNPKQLNLIDPWLHSQEIVFANIYNEVWNKIYEGLVESFKDLPSVVIHRGLSEDVLPTFTDNYFDWVYIDGNHQYEFAKQDFILSWQKTKPGGYVCGHDWNFNDVQQACLEMVNDGYFEVVYLTNLWLSAFPSFGCRVNKNYKKHNFNRKIYD